MDLSERHVRRLLGAYRELGAEGPRPRHRGRRPHNAVPEAVAAAVAAAATRYPGANHTNWERYSDLAPYLLQAGSVTSEPRKPSSAGMAHLALP